VARRVYRAVFGSFWTGDTGKQLKRAGRDAQVLAAYLMTSPHGTFIGVYHLPKAYIEADTGLTASAITRELKTLRRLRFATYLDADEWVFVINAYFHQCADDEGHLPAEGDNRVAGARAILGRAPKPLQRAFAERYGPPFQGATPAPSKGLTQPLADQVQVQETGTGTGNSEQGEGPGEGAATPAAGAAAHTRRSRAGKNGTKTHRFAVAFDWRVPVPDELHRQFIGQLAGDPLANDADLKTFYEATTTKWAKADIGDDPFKFWKSRFLEWIGTSVRTPEDLIRIKRALGPYAR
jgi:hypothetical protein